MFSSAVRRACAAAIGAAALTAGGALPAHAAGTVKPIKKLGTVNLGRLAAQAPKKAAPNAGGQITQTPAQQEFAQLDERRRIDAADGARLSGPGTPTAAPMPITVKPSQQGFHGEDIQDTVFTTGGVLEPPDQGLCGQNVGGTTYLFESVNLTIALYDAQSDKLTPSLDLNSFYGLPPVYDFSTGKYGPFLSDPKCYFDPETRHWFHTILEIDVNPDTGALGNKAATLIAVSAGSDPFGPYRIYSVDATMASDPNCPCLGDQPLDGADANGFYINTSEYGIHTNTFAGPRIFAFDKRALENGTISNYVVLDPTPQLPGGEHLTGTVQPAFSPTANYDSSQNGTEWLMSAYDCEAPVCGVSPFSKEHQIQVFGIENTQSLQTSSPDLQLHSTIIGSEAYQSPKPQEQPGGFHPLGESMGFPVPEVEANDSRMNQVVWAAGHLWGGVNTLADPGPRDAVAWFQVAPSAQPGSVSATVDNQGYVAGDSEQYTSFPSIGVTRRGAGVLAYSLMGSDFYPSSAYSLIGLSGTRGGITVAKQGSKPEDGFTCYPPYGEACRWGDYTASFALPSGQVWSATEWIDDKRTSDANWDTFVWPVTP